MKIINLLKDAESGKAINREEAVELLRLSENSTEVSLLRSVANNISRSRFGNKGLMLGQIGVDMSPCDGDCAFCFFAKSFTSIQPSILSEKDILSRCQRYIAGGARGVFLMTMHRFGFEWFRDLCDSLHKQLPKDFKILANVGDISTDQLKELRNAGVSGAYHVCRLREGVDSCMKPAVRIKTIERIIESGMEWYTMCEPIGPEHTPEEIADQIWLGVDMPCIQHGAMQRFPVPDSPLYEKGQISLARLSQIVAVIVLATKENQLLESIAVNVSNLVGLFSGANAFFPEAGEPDHQAIPTSTEGGKEGFTTALWRQSNEISTADCRNMFEAAGFSGILRCLNWPKESNFADHLPSLT